MAETNDAHGDEQDIAAKRQREADDVAAYLAEERSDKFRFLRERSTTRPATVGYPCDSMGAPA